MELKKINQFFRRCAEFQLRRRFLLTGVLVLLTLFGIMGLKKAVFSSSNEGWYDDSDAIEIAEKRFEERFGNNQTIGILVEAEDVFDSEVLTMIRELGDALLMEVPYADEINSLTELELSVGTAEGMAVINPLEDGIPEDPGELQKIRDFVLSRTSVADKLVSSDATETWISLSLIEYPEEDEWPVKGLDPMYEAGEAAVRVVTDPRWESDVYTLKAAGMPYTETEEREFMGKEAALRVISGLAVMILLLIVFLRSLRGVLVPVFTTAMGILLVFGFMGWFGINIDSTLMTLPLLLGMALSVGYSIHLVNAFKKLYFTGTERHEAVLGAVEKTGWPILFTVFTTMGSMSSFAFIGIGPVKWLGLSCAAVVFTVYFYVILMIPILFSFGRKQHKKTVVHNGMPGDKSFRKLGERVLNRPIPILFLFTFMVVLTIPCILTIQTNIDAFKFMGPRVPYMQRVRQVAESQLGSYLNYNITISFDEEGMVKEPDVLMRFETLLDHCSAYPLTKKSPSGVAKIFSLLDIIKDMNQTLNEDNPEFYAIPDNRELIAQMLFLYELSGGTKTYQWVDEEYAVLRAQVELPRFDSTEISRELGEIRAKGEAMFPDGEFSIVGSAVQFADMNDRLVAAELKSFLIALVIIAVLLCFVFGSLRTGLIGLFPNITPVLVIGGVMGAFSFQLDMMTMTIMPMLLGIAVDDTIHFINQIKYEFEVCGRYREAILRAFSSIGATLAMTTIILTFSFGAYMFSTIQTMRNIGILAPLGLIAALGTDYAMTPVLILLTKPFGAEREKEEKNIQAVRA